MNEEHRDTELERMKKVKKERLRRDEGYILALVLYASSTNNKVQKDIH